MSPNNSGYSLWATVAMLALCGTSSAHITLAYPTPWGGDQLTTSPLESTGSNYPCQQTSDTTTFYDSTGITNTLTIGGEETVSFSGSASHGGGSCQLALTSDVPPTASSSWQVMVSIMGGCPSTGASGTDNYTYTVPSSFTPGDYSFAWTWISKESGTPEYYMNCAPVTLVSGSSSKRFAAEENEVLMGRATLPELFVADLTGINSCEKPNENVDVVYPDPGTQVQTPALSPSYYTFTQTTCTPQVDAAAATGAADATTTAADAATTASAAAAESSSTSSTSTAKAATTSAAGVSASGGFLGTAPTATATTSSSAAASTGTTTSSSSSGSTLTGTCDVEGTFNCDGTQFQQCASGSWSVMQDLPAGTTCEVGESTGLWARRQPPSRAARRNRRRVAV
ncbi:hypothetical protein BX600DRAFT_469031 [Xylariales sp. PMI_506]|nr:hypothetical protein BX600DRAFT_469031 [Xylariales sp. PMI_506]